MNEPEVIYYLTSGHIENIAHIIAEALLNRKAEPIPPFSTRNLNLLESALQRPRSYFGQELYPTLPRKAAVLFYSLIKNHPFPNGNKRIATSALLVFLHVNDCWLNVRRGDLVKMAKRVASSKNQKLIERRVEEWIQAHRERMSSTESKRIADLVDRSVKLFKIRRPRKNSPYLPGMEE